MQERRRQNLVLQSADSGFSCSLSACLDSSCSCRLSWGYQTLSGRSSQTHSSIHTILLNLDTVLCTHHPTQPVYSSLNTPSYTTWIQFSIHTILHNLDTVLYTHHLTQPGYSSLYTSSYLTWIQFSIYTLSYTTWIQLSIHTILHNLDKVSYTHHPAQPGYSYKYSPSYTT